MCQETVAAGWKEGLQRKESGKRGRKPGRKSAEKVDMKAKLERSRQSARECRARKKLRYQYLEELVADREKAVLVLKKELDKIWAKEIDAGRMPDGIQRTVGRDGTVKKSSDLTMYKPPENSNRVKIIKSKFENNANDVKPIAKPLLRKSKTLQDFSVTSSSIRQEKLQANQKNKIENKNNPQTLSRQLSDPTKRNIKRTPAFRLDKSSDTNAGFVQNKTRYLEKFSKNTHLQEDIKEGAIIDNNNFSNILNKFNANTSVPVINDNGKDTSNVKLLYSEPVPKSQRTNEKKALDEDVLNVYNATTLKISESHSKNIKTNVHTKKEIIDITLTDTLKNALKKPLPKGPAPKKPPRTFLHSTNNNIS
ncbi:hypothetical protein FQR65_LT18925 [Abscondita terminalis]|nr:hypothetical protein FQR65_LT18925 [Abscondita terminalis]